MRLDQMYQEIILDHYRNPHGAGLREPFDAESFQINPTCGDEITLRVALKSNGTDATGTDATGTDTTGTDATGTDATGTGDSLVVADVSYDALGCSISQAAASVLTDLVVGRSVEESLRTLDAFQEMVQGRGTVEPDEDVLGDGVAFAGVARYPARVKCALLGWMAFKDAVVRVTGGPGDAPAAAPEGNGAKR
jgi:nitrogen fixation NifU-like protein